MRTVAEHRARVLDLVRPLEPAELPLLVALGHVLAEDVRATTDLPAWDNSAMDGYAVHAADLADATPDSPVTVTVAADLPAGVTAETAVEPGTAARIMTGAPMPGGADAVVPVEATDAGTATVTVRHAPTPGDHIRRRGEDVRAGDLVLPAGTLLAERHLAAAAAAGAGAVRVHRRPRIAVLATGSELVDPGTPCARGQIPDSNSVLLAAAVTGAGCTPVRLPAIPDDVGRLHATLTELDGSVDLVVTSGGVSVGAYDVVKAALAGGDVEFTTVAMQPGKPQGLGRLPAGTPVVCLPGNPVSVFVSFEVFLRPALARMRGLPETGPATVTAVAERGWRTPAGREQYMPVVIVDTADGHRVRPATERGSGSHLAARLARCDGLAVVPADAGQVDPGDVLTVFRCLP